MKYLSRLGIGFIMTVLAAMVIGMVWFVIWALFTTIFYIFGWPLMVWVVVFLVICLVSYLIGWFIEANKEI